MMSYYIYDVLFCFIIIYFIYILFILFIIYFIIIIIISLLLLLYYNDVLFCFIDKLNHTNWE